MSEEKSAARVVWAAIGGGIGIALVVLALVLWSTGAFAQTRSDPSPSCFRAADGAVVCVRFDAHAVPVGGVAHLIALGLGVFGLTLRRLK